MDPSILTALGIGSSLLGSLFSKNSSDKQIKAQREEAALNRAFNAEQASLQRDFITSQIVSQNEYNSPAQVVERLKSAGLNPNLAYQNIGSGQQISNFQGSAASNSSSVGTGLPDFSGFQSVLQAAQVQSNIKLQNSQAEKNIADAKLAEANTKEKSISNSYLPQILQGQVDLNGTQIKLNTANLNLTSAQIRQIDANISNLNAGLSEIQSRIKLNNLTAEQISESMPYIVRELAARADLSEKQAKYYVAGVLSQIGMQSALTSLHYSQSEINKIQAEFLPSLLNAQLSEIDNRIRVGDSQISVNEANSNATRISSEINLGKNRAFVNVAREDTWYNNYIVDPILGILGYIPFTK